MSTIKYSLQPQSGVTLVISLVLLLLLTMIGVSGMKISGLQEKMAGNDRDHSLALQAAEAALRAGERKIEEIRFAGESIRVFCNGSPNKEVSAIQPTGLFHRVQADNKTSVDTDHDAFCQACANDCPEPSVYSPATWTDANSIQFNTGNALLGANQPRYFITYVETNVNPKKEGNRYFPPVYVFTVTARGTGAQGTSEVLLHSYAGGSTDFNN